MLEFGTRGNGLGEDLRVGVALAEILEPLVVKPGSVDNHRLAQNALLPPNITAREVGRSAGISVPAVTEALNGGLELNAHGGRWKATLGDENGRVPRRFRSSGTSGLYAEMLAESNRVVALSLL